MNLDKMSNNLESMYYDNIKKTLTDNNIQYEFIESVPVKIEINETEKVVYNEVDELYKKPWQKLNTIHKILKIKEFVNNLNISSNEEKEKLKGDLIMLIKNKILTKKENVDYDDENGKILNIKKLQYNNKYYITDI
jgi:hypothetical protein